jgi:2,3-diketo-5-methylthio-1-phosphopentane phosphatase
VLLDVEGTTTALSFVRDRLFPLARRGLRELVETRRDEPVVGGLLEEALRIAEGEGAAGETSSDPASLLERWMDADRKLTPLKTLQGMLWEDRYRSGELVGHVYDDVPGALGAWRARGLRIFVFSSGSVLAQRSLFAHTAAGDLTGLIDGWFDTAVGAKDDPESYRAIARHLGFAPEEIVFLSDSEVELDAAADVGVHTVAVDRAERRLGAHPVAVRLDALPFPLANVPWDSGSLRAAAVDGARAADLRADLAALARRCHARGWVDATSGNFSARVDACRIAITRSGLDKGRARPADLVFVEIDGVVGVGGAGVPAGAVGSPPPSAETPLHLALYRWSPLIGAVAHTHSRISTAIHGRLRTTPTGLSGPTVA